LVNLMDIINNASKPILVVGGGVRWSKAGDLIDEISKKLTAFDFFGPTCDSMDYMKGPFLLPNNIKENDYIELGQLGAYGLTFRTKFNGYYSNEIYEVEDNPIMTMYDKDINKANMVA